MHPSPLSQTAFDFPQDLLWVAHCADGPLPRASADAILRWLQAEQHPWHIDWPSVLATVDSVRQAAAAILQASTEDVTLVPSTSTALAQLAQAFPWESGDEVLVPLGEFPSNAWPWKALEARGVSFREVPLWDGQGSGFAARGTPPPPPDANPEARILEALGPRTRLLALSWIRFQDGLRLDLRSLGEACHARGIVLVVDGIQGCGTHIPDLTAVDAFTSGGQKGLLGPQGTGLLWTAPAFRQRLVPTGSWLSVLEGGNFALPLTDLARPWLTSGRRLENQTNTSLQVMGWEPSLKLLAQAPVPAITQQVHALQKDLLQRLANSPIWSREVSRLEALLQAQRLGPILAFHAENAPEWVARGLAANIHSTSREGYLRVAFHGWHTPEDVLRVTDWLNETAS